MNEVYHIPAMLKETIEGLNVKPEGVYVDVTFGGGGHSRAILEAGAGHLYSFDQDIEALHNAELQMDNGQWTMSGGRLCTAISGICGIGWIITG